MLSACDSPVSDTPSGVAVTGVTLSQSSVSLLRGAAVQLTATVAPSDATDTSVTWASSDEDVATVSSSGLVTAVASGTATVTVTTTDGGFEDEAAITVTLWGDSFVVDTDFGTSGVYSLPSQNAFSYTYFPDGTEYSVQSVENINVYGSVMDSSGNTYVLGHVLYLDNGDADGTADDDDIVVFKLDSNGDLVTSFGDSGVFYFIAGEYGLSAKGGYWWESYLREAYAPSIAIDSNDKIYVAFSADYTETSFDPSSYEKYWNKDLGLLRLTTDGNLDTTFDGNGVYFYGKTVPGYRYYVNGVVIDSDDNPYVFGTRSSFDDTTVDAVFSGTGEEGTFVGAASYTYVYKAFGARITAGSTATTEWVFNLADETSDSIDPEFASAVTDSTYIYFGSWDGYKIRQWELADGDNGSLDPVSVAGGVPRVIETLSDGSLIAYYQALTPPSTWTSTKGIVRIGSDGSPVSGFGSSGIVALPSGVLDVIGFTEAEDGNILVFGTWDSSGTNYPVVFKLDSTSGALVTDFGTNGLIVSSVSLSPYGITISPENSCVVFSGYVDDSTYDTGVMRMIAE